MTITFDIAAKLTAIIWPLLLVAVLFDYRKSFPGLAHALLSRITKVEGVGISLDLAVAKPVAPDWSDGVLELRNQGASMKIGSNSPGPVLSMLQQGANADYAEVDVGTGQSWLSSRLYLLSIVLAQVKGVKAFVFVETVGPARKRYVRTSEPSPIRLDSRKG